MSIHNPQLDVILHGPRLTLRPLQRADLDAMAAWPPYTAPLDQEWNWARRLRDSGWLDIFFASQVFDPRRYAWTILSGQEVIGIVQLSQIGETERDAFLGIALGVTWIGKGYGREALDTFLSAYFGQFQFHILRLEVGLTNSRALSLYRTAGFQETKRFWRETGFAFDDRILDQPEYARIRSLFRRANSGIYQLYAQMELSGRIP